MCGKSSDQKHAAVTESSSHECGCGVKPAVEAAQAAAQAATNRCAGHSPKAAGGSPWAGRHVMTTYEMEMPEVKFPAPELIAQVGEAALRRLVRRHHERLRASEIAHLFASDDAGFEALIERVADFVVEACHGPVLYTPKQGDTCMRTRHLPFTIDEHAREVWLEQLFHAMADIDFPEAARADYWAWLEPFSVRMINRRTLRAQPPRLPWEVARMRFGG